MIEKLSEKVEVRTFLTQIHCPNKSCGGVLACDGRTRNTDGRHGAPLEYRHVCPKCNAGYWLKEQYPKVSYEQVISEAALAAMREIQKRQEDSDKVSNDARNNAKAVNRFNVNVSHGEERDL